MKMTFYSILIYYVNFQVSAVVLFKSFLVSVQAKSVTFRDIFLICTRYFVTRLVKFFSDQDHPRHFGIQILPASRIESNNAISTFVIFICVQIRQVLNRLLHFFTFSSTKTTLFLNLKMMGTIFTILIFFAKKTNPISSFFLIFSLRKAHHEY